MNESNTNRRVVHFTFSTEAKRFLDQGIANGDVHGECLLDEGMWDVGPLRDRTDSRLVAWCVEHFGSAYDNRTPAHIYDLDPTNLTSVAWFHPRYSTEYANFLHWVANFRPEQLFIAHPDGLSAVSDPRDTSPLTDLMSAAFARGSISPQAYVAEWRSLEKENGDFRLFNTSGQLQTFSSSHFVDQLLSLVVSSWEPAGAVVARALESLWQTHCGDPGDRFFFRSIERLRAAGMIETRTSGSAHSLEIRRIGSQASSSESI